MRSAMAKPAASSDAELIFLPEDNLYIAVARSLEDSASDRCAFKEPMFVLTTILITDPCFTIYAATVFLLRGASACRFLFFRQFLAAYKD